MDAPAAGHHSVVAPGLIPNFSHRKLGHQVHVHSERNKFLPLDLNDSGIHTGHFTNIIYIASIQLRSGSTVYMYVVTCHLANS